MYDGQRLVAHCLLYSTNLAFGKNYLYAPKGPIFLPTLDPAERKEALELILSQIRDVTVATRRREEIFCRIEPNVTLPELTNILMKPSAAIQPKVTIYRALDIPADELFASFKEKTRYNIRLAEKKGVTVLWSQEEADLKHFLSMLNKTKRRNRIRSHDARYYQLLLKADEEKNTVYMNYAVYQGKTIAANLYVVQYPTMTYLHGGFDYSYRGLMAPHLLQWNAMQKAYAMQLGYYDFWGYEPSDGSKPSLANVSRFKQGYSGRVVESPGTFDFIYNPLWYGFYEKARAIRRSLRI